MEKPLPVAPAKSLSTHSLVKTDGTICPEQATLFIIYVCYCCGKIFTPEHPNYDDGICKICFLEYPDNYYLHVQH